MSTLFVIPLLLILQVLIENLKTPGYTIFFLQPDPLRRFEFWRLVTFSLIHEGEENRIIDPFGTLFFGQYMLCQAFYGVNIEILLGWRPTLIICFASALFGSLFSAAMHPCYNNSVGSSCIAMGLIAAHLSGHLMNGQRHPCLEWKPVWVAYFTWFLYVVMRALRQNSFIIPIDIFLGPFDESANLGGTVGGFLAGVYFWEKVRPLRPYQRRNRIAKICKVLTITILLVLGDRYLYFGKVLSANLTIKPNMQKYLLDNGLYEPFSQRMCQLYWNGNVKDSVLVDNVLQVMKRDIPSEIVHLLKNLAPRQTN